MTIHKSVLLKESIESLNLKEGAIIVDATLGGGGHSLEILKKIGKSGKLIAIDADKDAIKRFGKKIEKENIKNAVLVQNNFRNLESILEKIGINKIDAILADIGYSSDQLEDKKRGISFQINAPLDMRFDQNQELTAQKIINEYSKQDLEKILREYGEEKFYKNIVRGIIEYREKKNIENTEELVEIIKSHTPDKYKRGKIHPATKTFQAIRIEVNQELSSLRAFVSSAINALKPNGRLAVISFHSLEDRIVKEIFRENARGCICPENFPLCRCGNLSKIKIITKKPTIPRKEEIENNPRARSAKLRICEAITPLK
ncbi:MAG TPA: 16S rRNA (cytosine(1402)-N(4))-methyltransferase [Candidatus Moranbacteria bacterium]|nr:16S rRNA (cytosine(1402)-N(4))-methyltransferase [Candidatus Moranbacteria bacterium]HAT74890.1 16S rRNA (cytosine(1402)-N(4))-methyltransferase [Candidatus Moranbacteria bacterium]